MYDMMIGCDFYRTQFLFFIKEVAVLNTLLSVAIALFAGLLMTRLFKPFKLPSVTAYLIAGVLI